VTDGENHDVWKIVRLAVYHDVAGMDGVCLGGVGGRDDRSVGIMWIIYIMVGVLGFCWLTLLLDIFWPGWDRDQRR
jgi:hypothetical protein